MRSTPLSLNSMLWKKRMNYFSNMMWWSWWAVRVYTSKLFAKGWMIYRLLILKCGIISLKSYEEKGLTWLQKELQQKDPEFYKVGEMQNPQRMMRALEVMESTGQSVLHFRKGKKTKRDFDIITIGLELPKEQLHENINTRVDKMMEAGLVDEVKSLQLFKQLNALQTVGYSEIYNYLEGSISLEKAVVQIKTNTRQYAKRQMTWFRKDEQIKWFSPLQVKEIIEYAEFIE